MAYFAKSDSPITLVTGEEAPPPLVIWGPGDPRPTVPIAGWDPSTGTWPIPPAPVQPPDGFWGAGGGSISNPIAEPPWGWGNSPPEVPAVPNFKPVAAWTPETGWVTILVPTGPTPTPSKRR